MVPAENKTKRLILVNHNTKTIHHHVLLIISEVNLLKIIT